MLRPIDQWYANQPGTARTTLEFLRGHILQLNPHISEAWKYGMPFFCFRGKMCCYLWIHKKERLPYIGFVEGNRLHDPALKQEKRARMKILLIDPDKDLPMKKIDQLLHEMLALYE